METDTAVVSAPPLVEAPQRSEEGSEMDESSKPNEVPKCFFCVVCKQDRGNDVCARLLPCLHHICSDDCLDKSPTVNGSSTIVCAECSVTFEKHQIGQNRKNHTTKSYSGATGGSSMAATNMKEKSKPNVICTYCDEGPSASYCIDCKEFLCTPCTNYHVKMKMTKTHVHCSVEEGLLSRENESEYAPTGTDAKCELHDEPYILYCGDCDEELCSKCSKTSHSGHDVRNFAECVKQFREMLQSAIPDLITYRSKTEEAILDLESKMTNILGTERVKLLASARTHFHKVQAIILQRELDLRAEIVKKTLYKAKELNVKRGCIHSIRKQAYQYLELIPKLLDYKDHELFSKRQWLTKQYFRLRESVGVLLDDKSYKDYVESEWFFHIGDGVLLESIVALKALGSFVYTDGVSIQDKMNTLYPTVSVPTKPGTVEDILEKKFKDKHIKELTDHLEFSRRKSAANGDALQKTCDLEIEALEASVENEYIGFDILKQRSTQNIAVKDNTRFLPGTTLASLLDEKTSDRSSHPIVSDLLSKYIADKTTVEDGADSNSEYDPVVLSAQGIDKRRHTHSDSEEEQDATKEQRRKSSEKPKSPTSNTAKAPTPTTAVPLQPVRKSSRFEVSPRPGLALAAGRLRRSAIKEDGKATDSTKALSTPRSGSKKIAAAPTPSTSSGTARKASSTRRNVKSEAPPRLTREVYLDAEEVDKLLATSNESEQSNDEGGGSLSASKQRKSLKRRKQTSSDDDFKVSGDEQEDRRKSKASATVTSSKRRKDPFTAPRRRKPKKKSGELAPSKVPNLALNTIIQGEKMKISNDIEDQSEDYCSVCQDGGDDLICCDNCPRVFHIQCHVPSLSVVPPDAWQCLFCVEKEDLSKYACDPESTAVKAIIFPPQDGLNRTDFIFACKLITDIYALKGNVALDRLLETLYQPTATEEPMRLSTIRGRLTLTENEPFKTLKEVQEAVLLMEAQAKDAYKGKPEMKTFLDELDGVIRQYFPSKVEETKAAEQGEGDGPTVGIPENAP